MRFQVPDRNGNGDFIDMLAQGGRIAVNALILLVVGLIILVGALVYVSVLWLSQNMVQVAPVAIVIVMLLAYRGYRKQSGLETLHISLCIALILAGDIAINAVVYDRQKHEAKIEAAKNAVPDPNYHEPGVPYSLGATPPSGSEGVSNNQASSNQSDAQDETPNDVGVAVDADTFFKRQR